MLAAVGQERNGRGKPIKNTGRQKSGRSGAANTVEVPSIARTTGNNMADETKMGTVHLCLCFGSFHDVIVRVTMKATLLSSRCSLSRQAPTSINWSPSPAVLHQAATSEPRAVTLRQTTDTSNRELKVFCHTCKVNAIFQGINMYPASLYLRFILENCVNSFQLPGVLTSLNLTQP